MAEGLLATAAVPFLLVSRRARRYCGMDTIDGGLTDVCPAFEDSPRPCLYVT